MSLAQTGGLQNLLIVVPNSPPNVAAYAATDIVTIQQGQPSMMTNYADSTIDHFDLKSFYYGCSASTQASVAAVPTSCTVTIKGYADDGAQKLVATQDFPFTVGAGLLSGETPGSTLLQTSAQMLKANVNNKFKGLKRVDFFVDNNLIKTGLIDTVSYTVYSNKKIS